MIHVNFTRFMIHDWNKTYKLRSEVTPIHNQNDCWFIMMKVDGFLGEPRTIEMDSGAFVAKVYEPWKVRAIHDENELTRLPFTSL